MAKKVTIGSVNMIRNAMVVTNLISLGTLILVVAMAIASSSVDPCCLTSSRMTSRGRVSGMKHMTAAKAPPMITLKRVISTVELLPSDHEKHT